MHQDIGHPYPPIDNPLLLLPCGPCSNTYARHVAHEVPFGKRRAKTPLVPGVLHSLCLDGRSMRQISCCCGNVPRSCSMEGWLWGGISLGASPIEPNEFDRFLQSTTSLLQSPQLHRPTWSGCLAEEFGPNAPTAGAEELQRRRLVRAARGGLRRWAQRGARRRSLRRSICWILPCGRIKLGCRCFLQSYMQTCISSLAFQYHSYSQRMWQPPQKGRNVAMSTLASQILPCATSRKERNSRTTWRFCTSTSVDGRRSSSLKLSRTLQKPGNPPPGASAGAPPDPFRRAAGRALPRCWSCAWPWCRAWDWCRGSSMPGPSAVAPPGAATKAFALDRWQALMGSVLEWPRPWPEGWYMIDSF